MDKWYRVFDPIIQEVSVFVQDWWIRISAFVGSYWLIIKKICPWIKGLWEASKKIKKLEDKRKYFDLREELLATKEALHLAKKDIERLNEQLTIKESVTWEGGILYYNNAEICSRCYDTSSSVDRQTVRLKRIFQSPCHEFLCPNCKNSYEKIV